MRPRFTDLARIKKRARRSLETDFLSRWWAKKHGLPTNHELLLAKSQGAILREMYADWAQELEQLESQMEWATGAERAEMQSRYERLAEILGEEPTVDDWEAIMKRGERPDVSRFALKE